MTRKILLLLSSAFLFTLVTNNTSFSQDKWWKEKRYKNEAARQKHDLCKKTFKDIAIGFTYNNVNMINPYFDSQIYLNVISNEKGYYSSSQAEYILSDFMDYFKIENFKYTRSNKFNSYAFVNGIYTYRIGQKKLDLAVTVSLKYYDNKWFIDQITIN
ncbi:MAG: DUF4783 domain-containing protein [Bacteroidetes bacterium]|nr:DUF4783 domain-containing protein [Bacteroidota bacterium]